MKQDNKEGLMVLDEPAPETAADAPVKLSEIAEGAMAPEEIELAVKVGTVVDDEEAKKEEPKNEDESVKKSAVKAKPEFLEAFEDPEKEQELFAKFNPNEKAMYKNSRGLYRATKAAESKRKAAEIERDHVLMKQRVAEEKAKRLEAELEAIKTAKPKEEESEVDAFGNKVKKEAEDEKPLTKKDLEYLKAKEAEEQKKKDEEAQEKNARAQKLVEVLNAQEADLMAEHEDAAEALTYADAIYKAAASNTLDKIFPSPKMARKAYKLCVDFFHATANADKFGEDDYTAADVAYDLGRLHPEFGKKKDAGGASAKEDGGQLSPDKVNKIVKNADKRPSSASVTAGGDKHFVPYEEMTMEQLAGLSDEEYAKVPRTVRERLLRGDAA